MSPSKQPLYIEEIVEPYPTKSRSFAKAYPQIVHMWDQKRNCGFGPEDFSYGSTVRAWFKCPKGNDHSFQIKLSTMGKSVRSEAWSVGCGYCRGMRTSVTNNLAEKYPAFCKEWMTRKNGFKPDEVSYGSGRMVWWKCRKGHVWQASISNRTTNDSGCFKCNRGAPTDLRDFPEVLKEFDHQRNPGVNPFSLPVGFKVAWVCSVDSKHKWVSGFYRTNKGIRCIYCANKQASKSNSLKTTHPILAKQWHPLKNGKLKSSHVTSGSQKRVWWKCKKGPDHEWETTVCDRVKYETGCPFCSFRRTSITNVISTVAPDIASEWHPSKNGKTKPQNERAHSRTPRWWKCSICDHEWCAEPHRRIVRRAGCPECVIRVNVKRMLKARGIKVKKKNIGRKR